MLPLLFLWALCAVASGDECFGKGLLSSMSGIPKCYQFVASLQDYDEAAAMCYTVGGYIVSVANQLEEMFIVSNSHENFAYTDYWIGLTNLVDGTWRWDDETPYDYNYWATDAPQNDTTKSCVTGRLNTGRWFNVDCSETRYFICETEPLNYPVQSVPTKHCPSFTADGISFNKCYFAINSLQTYRQARTLCENFDGMGVSILNGTELLLVSGIARTALSRQSYWIGLDRLFDGVHWQWADGDTYDVNNANWAPLGYPTNKSGDDCAMALAANSKWQNKDCSTTLSFICEMKPTLVLPSNSSETICFDRKWTYFAFTESLYYVIGYVNITGNWFDQLETICVGMGAHLPSIHSMEEYTFVSGLGGTSWATWGVPIGYHSKTDVNSFEWSDGSDDDFSKWQTAPTSANLCSYVQRKNDGFVAVSCNTHVDYIFVCKKPYA